MSRIFKKEILFNNESISLESIATVIRVKNKSNTSQKDVHINPTVKYKISEGKLIFTDITKSNMQFYSTAYILIKNAIESINNNYKLTINLNGVGFKVLKKENKANKSTYLVVSVGKSHDFCFLLPQTIEAETNNDTELVLKSFDKELVSNYAANIKLIKKPEPYKGKGVFINGETILRKEGKRN